jgi:hypothetical protein
METLRKFSKIRKIQLEIQIITDNDEHPCT